MILRSSGLIGAMLLCLASLPSTAAEGACRGESFEGAEYTVCSFDLTKTALRVVWRNEAGDPYRTFSALAADLEKRGETLTFAMNGGMYDSAFAPVGLLIEHGRELKPANTADAAGNFHMKPNGVFYIDGAEAGVMETEAFLKARPETAFATQSGPMLVIDGNIHSRFIPGSEFLERRDGVGVASPTEVHFAISEGRVNFDEFARFFRDRLGCRNALFLDGGSAPGLYSAELGRNDSWRSMGPIIAAVE